MSEAKLVVRPAANKALREVLPGCPPCAAVKLCTTQEHLEAFFSCDRIYNDLNDLLASYFQGTPLPKQLDPTYNEFLRMKLLKLLRLYDLIAFGWDYLPFAGTGLAPGHVLQYLVLKESLYEFVQHLAPYINFTPRGFREKMKLLENESKLKAVKEDSTPIQGAKLKALETDLKAQRFRRDLLTLEHGIINTIRSVKKPSSDLREALKIYDSHMLAMEAWYKAQYHPRKARKGFHIVKGKQSPQT